MKDREAKRRRDEENRLQRKAADEAEEAARLAQVKDQMKNKPYTYDSQGNIIWVQALQAEKLPSASPAPSYTLRSTVAFLEMSTSEACAAMATPLTQQSPSAGAGGLKQDVSNVQERPGSGASTAASTSDLHPKLRPCSTQDLTFFGIHSPDTACEEKDLPGTAASDGSAGKATSGSLDASTRQAVLSELGRVCRHGVYLASADGMPDGSNVVNLLETWERDSKAHMTLETAKLAGGDATFIQQAVSSLVASGVGKEAVPQLAKAAAVCEDAGINEGATQALIGLSSVAERHSDPTDDLALAVEASLGLGAALRARNAMLQKSLSDEWPEF